MVLSKHNVKNQTYSYISLILFVILTTVNYIFLNKQADPFLATTVAQASSILVNGKLSSEDFCNFSVSSGGNWYWQGHTCGYTSSILILPGITLSILSLLTGQSPIAMLYIPVNSLIMLLSLAIIGKYLHNDIWNKKSDYLLKLLTFLTFTIALILYSTDVILGRFYTLEYHAYSLSVYALNLMILFKYIFEHNDRKLIVLFALLNIVNINVHYRAIYLVTGGLLGIIMYNTILFSLAKQNKLTNNKSHRALILMATIGIVLIYLKEFFIMFVGGHLNVTKVIPLLLNYISRFYEFSLTQQAQTFTGVSHIIILLEFFSKVFTYTALFYIIIVLILQILPTQVFNNFMKYKYTNVVIIVFTYLLGSSIVDFFAYFYAYGNIKFFKISDSWLLLLTLPVSFLFWGHRSGWSTTGRIFMVVVIVLLTFSGSMIAVATTILRVNYSALSSPPFDMIESFASYLTKYLPYEKTAYKTLTAGFSTASYLYVFISVKQFETINKIIIYNFPNYLNYIEKHNFIIITDIELNKGIFTDVFATTFISSKEIEAIYNNIIQRRNLIYNSILKCFD